MELIACREARFVQPPARREQSPSVARERSPSCDRETNLNSAGPLVLVFPFKVQVVSVSHSRPVQTGIISNWKGLKPDF